MQHVQFTGGISYRRRRHLVASLVTYILAGTWPAARIPTKQLYACIDYGRSASARWAYPKLGSSFRYYIIWRAAPQRHFAPTSHYRDVSLAFPQPNA